MRSRTQHIFFSKLGFFFSYIRIIKKPERSVVSAEEVPDRLVVDLHGREFQHEFPFLVLGCEIQSEPSREDDQWRPKYKERRRLLPI